MKPYITLGENMDDFLTIGQLGQLLKVSRTTINRYIRTGNLKAYKLYPGRRGSVRILKRDFLCFVKKYLIN
jgi:excisionase family DNA binding protein